MQSLNLKSPRSVEAGPVRFPSLLDARYYVGDFLTNSGILVYVEKFQWAAGAWTDAGHTRVVNVGRAGGSGHELNVNNANLEFAFPRVLPEMLRDALDSFEGRKGGLMWALNKADGKKIAEYRLDCPPVFDGLIAAKGKLYMSLKDGRSACWSPYV